MQALSDEQLRGKTRELQQKIAGGASLDDTLAEAFAVSGLLESAAVCHAFFDTAQFSAEEQMKEAIPVCRAGS